jgi:tight adherence protein B
MGIMMLLLFFFFMFSTTLFYGFFLLFILRKNRLAERVNYYLKDEEQNSEKGVKSPRINLDHLKDRVGKLTLKGDKNQKLDRLLRSAGLLVRPEEYVMFKWISTFLTAGLFYLLSGQFLLGALGALVGQMIPSQYVKKKQRDRVRKFNEYLPDLISSIVSGLRAGFSFPQALKNVAEESQSPLKEEIEIMLREMQYGSTLEEALNGLKERMPSEDLDLMVQAILIQRQVGGNLATVLDSIVDTIRGRIKLQRDIKTLTAQGRLSGMVIGFLPVILGLLLYMIEPEYIGSLFNHPVGVMMVSAGAISSIIGFFLIKKVITIEV